MDFAISADHWIKLKETEKRDKFLDLAWELKKLWNMKVTVISIEVGALGTITKGLIQELLDLEIKERVNATQTIALRPEYKESWRLEVTQIPVENH